MPTIRHFLPSDSLQELTSLLHRAYARLGAMGLNYTAVDQSTEKTAQRIAGGQCFVAESEGRLIGTIVVQPTHKTSDCEYFTKLGVASVHQFAVDPVAQGKGIGKDLLYSCETWAINHSFNELAIDTAEQAAHLINFYASLGYTYVTSTQWPGKVYKSVVLRKLLR